MTAEVVPFGKYKGQPVEVLAADHDYCEWLTAQPWFKARYLNVYNTVINYGTEPQDSPEHNQMQARFLDDEWCLALADALFQGKDSRYDDAVQSRNFEASGWDVVYVVRISRETFAEWPRDKSLGMQPWPERVHVECKPDLGDDYPTVLRQVQRYMSAERFTGTACVLVRRHAFTGVTWGQVREIFAASRIELLTEDDIDPRDGAA
jgi:hypothetical protein